MTSRPRRGRRDRRDVNLFFKKISVPFDTEIPTHRLEQPRPSQAADAFAVVDSPTIRTAEREPHFQFSTGGLGVRRPIEMEHALGGDSTMDIMPDLTDIILMLDLWIIVKLMSVLNYLQVFRRHIGCRKLVCFHFPHNENSITDTNNFVNYFFFLAIKDSSCISFLHPAIKRLRSHGRPYLLCVLEQKYLKPCTQDSYVP